MVDVLIRMNPDCGPLYPLTQPPEGVDMEQAAYIAQLLTGDEWTVAEVTDGFPAGMQKPYDYREPKAACWFVSLVRSDLLMVGGGSRLVLISQRSGQVVAEYEVPGE
jgi:hypothetical protein